MLWHRAPVHLSGSMPLVGRAAASLRADGRPVILVEPADLGRLRPSRVQTLILADPPEPGHLVAALIERWGSARPGLRSRATRLILMHGAGSPPSVPQPGPRSRLHLETFPVEGRGLRALLARWPLHSGMDPPFGQVPHLLIAGRAPPADAFVVQAMRLIQYGDVRPRLTWLSPDPAGTRGDVGARFPQAGAIAELRHLPLGSPDLSDTPPVSLALVSLADPVDAGLGLARVLVACIAEQQGASPILLLEIGDAQPCGGIEDWDGQILPVSYAREACRPAVLLDEVGDGLARSIHAHYRDSIAAQGRDPGTEPAGRAWPDLAESYRQASRHQADHLWAKLAVTDCRAVPEERVDTFVFAPLEVERLAMIEHRRWAADRYLDGWTYAPTRDNVLRHHPQLIPYANLSEPMKDLDRFAVRGVPTLLARSGLGVVRRLILGVWGPEAGVPAEGLASPMSRVLRRLLARYPDRALTIASTLSGPAARRLVRQALDEAGAGFFWLLPQPIGALLAAQPDRASRHELLELAIRAERRIPLRGEAERRDWLSRRADILLDPVGGHVPEVPAKRIALRAGVAEPEWSFEY